MKFNVAFVGLLGFVAGAYAETYLQEQFTDGEAWTKRWTPSSYRADLGKFNLTAGKWFADDTHVGIQTSEDYRYYAISTPLKKTFANKDKNLVLQFTVKHEQKLDCGGGYVKLLKPKFDAAGFNGDTEYNIMFGPDLCGTKSIVHVIFNYKGKNLDMKKTIAAPNDQFTHTYTLIVKPDQTYQVLLDGEEKGSGNMLEDWDFLPPKTIPDPDAKKPEDWVDEEKIPDPEDKKPEGWDDIPEYISDPEAKKPEDWDDEMDGDWEAPSVPNPDYLGEWKPKMIDNPAYKGVWVHPIIDNPEYTVDNNAYAYETAGLGIDIWQVKSGTIFDNFLITDEVEVAETERKAVDEFKVVEAEAKTEFDKNNEEADKTPEEDDQNEDEDDEEFKDDIETDTDIDFEGDETIKLQTENENSKQKVNDEL